jgi:hypothetical protein
MSIGFLSSKTGPGSKWNSTQRYPGNPNTFFATIFRCISFDPP